MNLNLEFHRRTNIKSTSPRSERQNYRTARGGERVMHPLHLPACYRKRFRIFSAVRSADSSNRFGLRSWLTPILIISCLFAGCGRHDGGGISSGTGGWPTSSSSSPIEVSSSAQVVKVSTEPVEIAANGSAEAIVKLSISPGYHINANPATFSYLIATEVRAGPDPDHPIMPGKPIYPSAVKKQFALADQPLAVYEGDIVIKLPMNLPTAKQYLQIKSGLHLSQSITVRVQACDNEKCYPPANLDANITVTVK